MAKINCSKHGTEIASLVSPDIALSITSQNFSDDLNLIKIFIETILENPSSYWVTKEFSSKYGGIDFKKIITLDILEDIECSDNDFYSELKPVCSICLREFLEKYIPI